MPKGPKLHSNAYWLKVVEDIAAADQIIRDAAITALRREVGDYVEHDATLPIAWIDASPPARRTIARQVVDWLLYNDFHLLKEWQRRFVAQRDHATFATMVNTVVLYCAARAVQAG